MYNYPSCQDHWSIVDGWCTTSWTLNSIIAPLLQPNFSFSSWSSERSINATQDFAIFLCAAFYKPVDDRVQHRKWILPQGALKSVLPTYTNYDKKIKNVCTCPWTFRMSLFLQISDFFVLLGCCWQLRKISCQ